MRAHSIVGLMLITLGVLTVLVRGFTYYSTGQAVGPLGFFAWEVESPHTVIISPIAGILAIVIGGGLLFLARRRPVV